MDPIRPLLRYRRALRQIFQPWPINPRPAVRQLGTSHPLTAEKCLRIHRKRPTPPSPQQQKQRRLRHRHLHFASQPSHHPTKNPIRTFRTSSSTPSPSSPPPPHPSTVPAQSLTQRLRNLSREYGYAALGVYLALSAVDLPFCYVAVSHLGTERIGRWEHVLTSYVKGFAGRIGIGGRQSIDVAAHEDAEEEGRGEKKRLLEEDDDESEERRDYVFADHGYREAEKADQEDNASVWTKFALAYAIHKSFIFMRVPLTAAVTPKVVKTLRGWGWKIGKKRK